MRVRSALNGALLVGNVVLFGLITAVVLNHRGEVFRTAFWNRAEDDAAKMGMDVSFAKSPFAFFTTKGHSRTHRFTLAQYDPLLLISADVPAIISSEENNGRDASETPTTLMLQLGQEFSTIIDYSCSPAGAYRVHSLEIIRDRDGETCAFFDTNADGSYDLRLLRDKLHGVSRQEVWFAGSWRETENTIDKDHKILVDGQEVRFNRRTGKWQPKAEY